MRGVATPAVTARVEETGNEEKYYKNGWKRKALWRRWNGVLGLGESGGRMFGASKVIFAEQPLFIQAQVARDGAHKPMAKDSAGQLRPIFIFQGFDETGADARSLGEFVHGNFAQFALALQAFTKISPGHEPEPVLDNPVAAPNGPLQTRRRMPDAPALPKIRLGFLHRHQ